MWSFFLGALISVTVQSKVVEHGVMVHNSQWHVLTQFCFDTEGGDLSLTFQEDENTPKGQQVLLYHDVETDFPVIYYTENSCEFKRNLASVVEYTNTTKQLHWKVSGARARWWYVVLANCEDPSERLQVNYQFRATNSGGKVKFAKHFGRDEEGIFEALKVTLVMILIIIGLYSFSFYKSLKNPVHQVHGVMLFVCGAELIAVILQLMDRSAYSKDGIGKPSLENVGHFFSLVPDVVLTALMVFISKGRFISKMRIEESSIRSVIEVSVVYTAVVAAMYIWNIREPVDHVTVESIYQSPPGVVLCVMRILLVFWFVSNLAATWSTERSASKKSFYVFFLFFGILHFLTLPIATIVSTMCEPWYKKKSVVIAVLAMDTATYLIMWFVFGLLASYIKSTDQQDDEGLNLRSSAAANMDDDDDDQGIDTQDVDFGPIGQTDDSD